MSVNLIRGEANTVDLEPWLSTASSHWLIVDVPFTQVVAEWSSVTGDHSNGWIVEVDVEGIATTATITPPLGAEAGNYSFGAAGYEAIGSDDPEDPTPYFQGGTVDFSIADDECDLEIEIAYDRRDSATLFDLFCTSVVTGGTPEFSYLWTLTNLEGKEEPRTSTEPNPRFLGLRRDLSYTLVLDVTDSSDPPCEATGEETFTPIQPSGMLVFPDWVCRSIKSRPDRTVKVDLVQSSESSYAFSLDFERNFSVEIPQIVLEEMYDLQAFWNLTRGNARAFLMWDRANNTIEAADGTGSLIGTWDGTTREFQLRKELSIQGRTGYYDIQYPDHHYGEIRRWNRAIVRPDNAVAVTVGGVTASEDDYRIERIGGKVKFTEEATYTDGAEIRAFGHFYHLVIFTLSPEVLKFGGGNNGLYYVDGTITMLQVNA